MKKVYGDRVCKNCRGLCAGYAFRKGGKKRKKYYCCLNCLHEKFPWIDETNVDFYSEMVEVKPPPVYI